MIEKILKKHNVYSIELEIELLRYFVEDRKKLTEMLEEDRAIIQKTIDLFDEIIQSR